MSAKNQLPLQVSEILKGLNSAIPSQLKARIELICSAERNNEVELKMIQEARIKQVKSISTISRKRSTEIKDIKEQRIHRMSFEDPEQSSYCMNNKLHKKKKINKRPRMMRLMSQQLPQTLFQPPAEQFNIMSPQLSNPQPHQMADLEQINFDYFFQPHPRHYQTNWFQQQKFLEMF